MTTTAHRIIDFQDLRALPSLLKQAVAVRMVSAAPREGATISTERRPDDYFVRADDGLRFDARRLAVAP